MKEKTVGKIEFGDKSLFPIMVVQKGIANNWEEEFEDKVSVYNYIEGEKQIIDSICKYLGSGKIKVKCRDGAILIERI